MPSKPWPLRPGASVNAEVWISKQAKLQALNVVYVLYCFLPSVLESEVMLCWNLQSTSLRETLLTQQNCLFFPVQINNWPGQSLVYVSNVLFAKHWVTWPSESTKSHAAYWKWLIFFILNHCCHNIKSYWCQSIKWKQVTEALMKLAVSRLCEDQALHKFS